MPDKQIRYVEETLPLIFAVAWDAKLQYGASGALGELVSPVWSLQEVHDWLRGGRYVREYGPKDEVHPPGYIVIHGGDCEDWAAYQLAVAWARGVPARVVTAGNYRDNFEHTYVEWLDGGQWVATNPKGSQEGMPYGRHSDWPLKRRWELREGRVVEISDVEGSAGDVPGSGAETWSRSTSTKLRTDPPRFVDSTWWSANVPAVVESAWRQQWNRTPPRSLTDRVDLQQYPFPQSVYPAGEVDFHSYFKLPKKLLPNDSLQLRGIKFPGPPAGADTTPVNTWGDFFRLLSESQQNWFWKSISYGQFGPLQVHRSSSEKVIQALEDRLDAGQLRMTRGEIAHWTRQAALADPGDFKRIRGSNAAVQRALTELDPTKVAEEVNTLESVNLAFASRWAAEALEDGEGYQQRRDTLIQTAINMGGNPNAKDSELAAVWAARVAQLATNQLIALDVLQLLARQHPEWDPVTLVTAAREASVTGSGSILSEFFEDAGRWLRRVFVTEVGKGIRALAKNILRVEASAPWASQYILRPLGFVAQAQVLNQLGEAMVDGSIATFDEKAVATDFAKDLTAWGQALVVAAPFLSAVPPPLMWSTLSAAVGALAVAGGGLMQNALDENSVLNTGQLGQDQVRTFYVDEYGREIGPDGLPVDPYQRQAELQRRQQALQPDPNTQAAGEWRQGSDGFYYGWHDFGSNGQQWWWLALSVDAAGTITGAWAQTNEGWVQL